MSTFDETQHPRELTGRFTTKTRTEADVELATALWHSMSAEQADTAHSYLAALHEEAAAEAQWEEAALYARGAALIRERWPDDYSAPAPEVPEYQIEDMSDQQADTAYANLMRLSEEAHSESQWEEAALYEHLAGEVARVFPEVADS